MQKTKLQILKNPLVNSDGSVTARPCTNMDLCTVYGVGRRTMISWLKPFSNEIGQRISYFYTQKQVDIIFEKLGEPQNVNFENLSMVA
jgi:hypothetical protein